MKNEPIHIAFAEFQRLSTGQDMAATVQLVEDLKAGKKFIVDNDGKKFRVILDEEDTPILKPL